MTSNNTINHAKEIKISKLTTWTLHAAAAVTNHMEEWIVPVFGQMGVNGIPFLLVEQVGGKFLFVATRVQVEFSFTVGGAGWKVPVCSYMGSDGIFRSLGGAGWNVPVIGWIEMQLSSARGLGLNGILILGWCWM